LNIPAPRINEIVRERRAVTADTAIDGVRQAYKPFAPSAKSAQPTNTLITKIILGTFGCLPACDRYFIDGFNREELEYSWKNDQFIKGVLGYCRAHLADLQREQANIEESSGIRYPLMKLLDMYFWQIGFDEAQRKKAEDSPHQLS
jgi:hypothetical protein